MSLELYYFPACPFCVRVLKVIESLGIGEQIELKNIMQDDSARTFLLEQTGRQTVPCLFIDGEPMFESEDIVSWLSKNQSSLS